MEVSESLYLRFNEEYLKEVALKIKLFNLVTVFTMIGIASGCAVAPIEQKLSTPFTLSANQLLAVIPVGSDPHRLAIGEGALWVANSGANTVSRIDLKTDQVVATIEFGTTPASLLVAEGAVWVANNFASSVSRIDPKTSEVIATIKVGEAWYRELIPKVIKLLRPLTLATQRSP